MKLRGGKWCMVPVTDVFCDWMSFNTVSDSEGIYQWYLRLNVSLMGRRNF